MKILFDARVHLNYFSGISRYIICLLDSYLNLFPNDTVVVLLNPTITEDNSIYTVLGHYKNLTFKVVNAGHMGPKNYLMMGSIIKKIKPDVYHYPHLDTPIFTGKIPIVSTVHDVNTNNRVKKYEDKFKLKSLYFKTALKLTIKYSSKVIFVSDAVKNEVIEDLKINQETSKKFVRIHNGLEDDFNDLAKDKKEAILSKLNINRPYLLFVGQIREHKNIRRVVEAYKLYNKDNPTHQLIIVGHNYLHLKWEEESITHIDKATNTELKALYSGSSALLFPSLFEGFGFPIIEAFSFGKQVVTSNYGATQEIGGNNAILVDPLSVESIKNGIKIAVIEDNKENERIQYSKTFSWKDNAIKLRKIYSSVQ